METNEPINTNGSDSGQTQNISQTQQNTFGTQSDVEQPTQPTQQPVQTQPNVPIQPPQQAQTNKGSGVRVDTGKAVVTTSNNDDSKKSVVLVVIGVLLIIILGVGGFYLYTQFTSPKEENSQQLTNLPTVNKVTQPPTAVPTQSTQQLSIYTDDVNGYSMNYSADFKKADYQEGDYYGISLTYLGSGQQRPQSELVDGVVLKTLVIDDSNGDLEGYVIQQRDNEVSDTNEVSDISETMLADRAGYEYTISGQGEYRVIFVENGGNIIRVSTNIQGSAQEIVSYKQMANEIIDSITFTQAAVTETPSVATQSASPTP